MQQLRTHHPTTHALFPCFPTHTRQHFWQIARSAYPAVFLHHGQ